MSPGLLTKAGRLSRDAAVGLPDNMRRESDRRWSQYNKLMDHAVDTWNKTYGIKDKNSRGRYMTRDKQSGRITVIDIDGDEKYIYYPDVDKFDYEDKANYPHNKNYKDQDAVHYKLYNREAYRVAREMVDNLRSNETETGLLYKKLMNSGFKEFMDKWNEKYGGYYNGSSHDYRELYAQDNQIGVVDNTHEEKYGKRIMYRFKPLTNTYDYDNKLTGKEFKGKDASDEEFFNSEPYIELKNFILKNI